MKKYFAIAFFLTNIIIILLKFFNINDNLIGLPLGIGLYLAVDQIIIWSKCER